MGHTHGRAWLEHSARSRLVAVADTSAARAEAVTSLVSGGGVRVYPDLAAMLADPEIDAIDICLPHHLHKDAIVAAAGAGKHVLCEKPLCLHLEEAQAIRDAVSKAGVRFMSAHNKLFSPGMAEARRLVKLGTLGRVYVVRTIEAGQNWGMMTGEMPLNLPPGESPWSWRKDPKRAGGGEVLDNGWHAVYCLLALAGSRPVEVSAMLGDYVIRQPEAEDTGILLVRFEDDSIGLCITSWAFADTPPGYEFQVAGERGSIAGTAAKLMLALQDRLPAERSFGRTSIFDRLPPLAKAGARRLGLLGADDPTQTPLGSSYAAEIGHFLDVVQQGTPCIAGWDEAARTLQVIRGAYRAAAERRTVPLPEDPTQL
jgi:predicted dehydrogenase